MSTSPRQGAPRLLQLDDDPRFRQLVQDILKDSLDEHCAFFEESDGNEIVAHFERHEPDLVLMDIDLHGSDGLRATAALCAAHPEARVVVLTMYESRRFSEAATNAGASACVLKDNLGQLSSVLRNLLHQPGPASRLSP